MPALTGKLSVPKAKLITASVAASL